MEQEKILSLILDKLEGIEKNQQEMKKEQQEIRKEQQEIKRDIKDINEELQMIKQDVKEIKSVQSTIQEFMLSTEKAIEVYEQDHRFIEKLKKVAGE